MSIYDTDVRCLPQVKVRLDQRQRLYTILTLHHRRYATFVRDVCDALTRLRLSYHEQSFNRLIGVSTTTVLQGYELVQRREPSVADAAQCYTVPCQRLVKLPTVTVSQWQYENLAAFLHLFQRTWTECARLLCDYVSIHPLDTQTQMVTLSRTTEETVEKLVDHLVDRDRLQGREPVRGAYVKKSMPYPSR